MKEYTIAITGLNAIDSPGPGIAVIRGLRESKHFSVRIIGLSYENLEPGIYMHDLVDKTYQIPYPSVGHETLMSRLAYVHEQEKLDAIIPNFDAELFSFIKLAPQLKAMGINTLLPSVEQFEARHKGNLPEYGALYGVNVPKSLAVFSAEDVHRELSNFKYPVVVKGKFYEAYIAQNEEQAINYFFKLSAKWGTPVILQQFVKGQEVNVTAIGDGKGRLMGAVPMRKTYITSTGKGWAGIAIDAPDLLEIAKNLVEKTQWPGGMEIEMIREDGTDKLYLIEINPRFPAWVYLAVGCGQNHPETAIRLAMGETDVEPFTEFESGKMFIRYAWDMICDLKEFEQIATTGEL